MKSEVKIRIEGLPHGSAARLTLDSPKNNETLDGSTLKIAGWAYAPSDAPMKIAIERKGSVFISERHVARPDVKRHLDKTGCETKVSSTHGFQFEFLGGSDVRIGFDLNGAIHWSHRIREDPQITFEQAHNITELMGMPEGVFRNVYFHNAEDWSKVVVFFNGALTPRKMMVERTIFQRWSWAKRFKHPVICIADPLTVGENPLVLAWYLGSKGRNLLPQLLEPIISEVHSINPDARLIGLGSSGGGFAAVGGVLTGHLDEAIAMNPQTDAMQFEVKSAVSAFGAARGHIPCDSDLKTYDFSQMKPGAVITYLQNLHDEHHRDVHYQPFREVAERTLHANQFRFIEYEDATAGHMPPDIDGVAGQVIETVRRHPALRGAVLA